MGGAGAVTQTHIYPHLLPFLLEHTSYVWVLSVIGLLVCSLLLEIFSMHITGWFCRTQKTINNFLKIYLLTWEGERECTSGGRGGGREYPSRLPLSMEADVGLDLLSQEMSTWAEIKSQMHYWLSHPRAPNNRLSLRSLEFLRSYDFLDNIVPKWKYYVYKLVVGNLKFIFDKTYLYEEFRDQCGRRKKRGDTVILHLNWRPSNCLPSPNHMSK